MTVRLAGLWGFALTPFRDGRVDPTAFTAGIERMVAGGVDVVCVGGTLGQGDRMSSREQLECLAIAVRADEGAIAGDVLAAGASALLVLPATGDPADALGALREIRRHTDGQLPVVLYQRGPLSLEPADLAHLVDEPNLVGVKDAHGDMRRFRRLHEAFGRRLTWIGASEDLMLAFWAYGADAASPASVAYAPAYARRVWSALGRGDRDEAVRLLRLFAWPVTDLRMSRSNIDVSVVREFAAEFGLPVGELRPPAEPLTADERDAVRRLAGTLRAELESGGVPALVRMAAS
jgi:dihydrodipicolinate synthase/N-acetylneuraminate lyase